MLFFAFWVFLTGPVGMAQEVASPGVDKAMEQRVSALQRRVNESQQEVATLSSKADNVLAGSASRGLLFLFGGFCALWAQNTNRSSVLWFFLGVIFTFIAVIVLLVKNSNDREIRRRRRVMERRVADR